MHSRDIGDVRGWFCSCNSLRKMKWIFVVNEVSRLKLTHRRDITTTTIDWITEKTRQINVGTPFSFSMQCNASSIRLELQTQTTFPAFCGSTITGASSTQNAFNASLSSTLATIPIINPPVNASLKPLDHAIMQTLSQARTQSLLMRSLFLGKLRQTGQSHSPLGSSVTPTHL